MVFCSVCGVILTVSVSLAQKFSSTTATRRFGLLVTAGTDHPALAVTADG